jgi:hypothetical protein
MQWKETATHKGATQIMTKKGNLMTAILVLAVIAFGSNARAQDNSSARRVEGSWAIDASPSAPMSLITFTQDGAVVGSRPPVVLAGSGPEFVSTGQGMWTQKANKEISATILYLRSSLTAEFTGITKVVTVLKAMDKPNELRGTATVEVFLANGNLLVSFPIPIKMTRIAVEH